MADVSIKFKGSEIASMNASGSKTLLTEGKYCEDDITVEYTDPEKPTQTKSMALGAAAPSAVTPDSGKVLSSVSPSIDTSVIKAANIAQGATILGVAGNLTPGITPTGTKQITADGTYDVTSYASANVEIFKTWDVTVAANQTASFILLTDSWLASHRADESLRILILPTTQLSSTAISYWAGTYAQNRPMNSMETDGSIYQMVVRTATLGKTATSSAQLFSLTSGTRWSGSVGRIFIDASGNLYIMASSSVAVIPATYRVYAFYLD